MKTHINDITAYALGFRFAVLDESGRCTGYYKDSNAAYAALKNRRNSRIVHLTGNKSAEIIRLERNGFNVNPKAGRVVKNPIKDFDLTQTNYLVPKSTMERFKESLAPGRRVVAGKPKFGMIDETVWPIADVKIPAPKGMDYLPHQIAGIAAMIHKKNVLLADEQGLGKTIEIIGYINALRPDKTLIVCPTIAVENWYDELNLWLADKTLKVLVFARPKKLIKKRKTGKMVVATVASQPPQFCKLEQVKVDGRPKTIYTPIANQESPDWNIVVSSYQSFYGKSDTAARAGAATVEAKPQKGEKKEEIKKPKLLSLKIREILRKFERGGGLDLLVLDEVHTIKNPTGLVTMAILGEPEDPSIEHEPYAGLASFANRKIFASGTPIVNKQPLDMFPALNVLDKDSFPAKRVFTDMFGGGMKRGRPRKGEVRMEQESAKNEEILGVMLRDTVMIRRKADDVLELPELIRVKIQVKETPEIQAARALEMKALGVDSEEEIEITQISGSDIDEDDVEEEITEEDSKSENKVESEDEDRRTKYTAAEIAELLNDPYLEKEDRIILQKALKEMQEEEEQKIIRGEGGGYLLNEITKARVAMGAAKAKQFDWIFKDVMSQTEGKRVSDKIVIFYKYGLSGDIIQRKLVRDLGYREDQIVRIDGNTPIAVRGDSVNEFKKDPSVKIFLATIETCSTAITLTCSNVSIFMEMDYRPAFNAQAEKRTHRYSKQNLTENVFCFYPFAPRSIDAGVFRVLSVKSKIQSKVLDSFPTEEQLQQYETQFKTPKMQGVKYPLEQRVKIRDMLQKVLKNWEDAVKKHSSYEMFSKYNVSYNDIYGLQDLQDEFENTIGYGGKRPEYTLEFPEDLIDKNLRALWALRSLANPSMYNGGKESVIFPDNITGITRNLFKPQSGRTYNYKESGIPSENNFLHQLLYLATLPRRVEVFNELVAERAGRRAAARQEESIEELSRIAREG